jgi:hypothetical protein
MDGAPRIPENLVAFLESGLSILIGTRDRNLRPTAARGIGGHVAPDRRSISIYLPRSVAERTLADLADNSRLATTFSRVSDHRSVQIKGRCLEIRDSDEEDRRRQERYLATLAVNLDEIGMTKALTEHLACWPSVTLRVAVEQLYEQTPGPKAGCKLEERAT